MAELSGKKVLLRCSDDKTVEIAMEYAQQSVTLKNMIEDFPDDETIVIPLADIRSEIVDKIIVYCDHHWKNPDVFDEKHDKYRMDQIIPWDQEFIAVPQQTLFELVLAANFLDIKPLFDLGCKTIAIELKKFKDPEDIRKYLNIKNDFTPEEEAAARKENEWCLEK